MVSVRTPDTTAAVAEELSAAATRGLTIAPRGAGTKWHWGTPTRTDVVLDTGRLAGVVDHAPGDLVVTAGAGTTLRALQTAVSRAGQRLALDPPSESAGATLGGILATGEAGPLRLRYGSGRDLLIGVEFVRADGVVAHAGGRVVKNVAGYDLGKLLCGSYGTLGVLTSATFRLHPLPAARRWVCRPVGTPLEVHDAVGELLAAQLMPSAIEMDLPVRPGPVVPHQRDRDESSGPGTIAVLLEGSAAGVAARADAAVRLLGADASTVESPPAWWGTYPFGTDDVALRLAAPIADLYPAVYALRDVVGGAVPVLVRGSVGAGVVHAALPGSTPPSRVAEVLAALREGLSGGRSGSCVVVSAPPEVRDAVDPWGPVAGLALMRRLKEEFDPQRRLAPGRFVGGI